MGRTSISREHIFFFLFFVVTTLVFLFFRIIFGPLLVAAILSYLLSPLVSRLERRGIHRSTSALTVLLLLVVSMVLGVATVGPILYDQLTSLFGEIPRFRQFVENRWITPLNEFIRANFGDATHQIPNLNVEDLFPQLISQASNFVFENITQQTRNVFSTLLLLILTPILTYFLMRDLFRLERFTLGLVPRDLRRSFVAVIHEVDLTLRSVVRGQLIIISLLSVLYSSAFALSGMRLGIAVGFVTGMVRIVPSMDVLIGGSLSILVLATYAAPIEVIIAVAFSFLAIQLLDIFFLTPRIMGQFAGIHPFVIILAVLCFADWFGFYGVLLAIPAAASLRVVLRMLVRSYHNSAFFRGTSPTEPAARDVFY